jgi:hypothetical protein
MAGQGREPAGERDKPHIKDVITASGDASDQPKSVDNAITCPHAMGQTPGSSLPPIANTITAAGPNK